MFTRPVKDDKLNVVFKLLKLKSTVVRALDWNRLGKSSPPMAFFETFKISIDD
jgi:hypothetical protein